MHTVPAMTTFGGSTFGAKAEAGWRIGSAAFYIEPKADLDWTVTRLKDADFQTLDTAFDFGAATSVRGSAGVRAGADWGAVMPYVGLYAVDEFAGRNTMTMVTNGGCPAACISFKNQRPGSYGRVDVGLETKNWHGLEGFLKAEDEFGGHTEGLTGRLGIRWQW